LAYFLGIDIGSSTSKAVLLEDSLVAARHILPSGTNYRAVAARLADELLEAAGLGRADVASTVATGQGAGRVDFADRQVADIRCCARGIFRVFPQVRTVIDVQGQFTQVLCLSDQGQVTDFAVSEKCASGSGCFLDIIANVLQVKLDDIGRLSLKSSHPVKFTTGCAVFGESEAVSRVAEGVPVEDILAGVHVALAEKVAALVDKVGLTGKCAMAGGGALDRGLVRRVAERLGVELLVPPEPRFITALGAAIMAAEAGGVA